MEYPIKVRNVCITDTNRKDYKYIVVRECRNHRDEIEYWFYNFTNDLYSATMMIRETENGIVLELQNVCDYGNNI